MLLALCGPVELFGATKTELDCCSNSPDDSTFMLPGALTAGRVSGPHVVGFNLSEKTRFLISDFALADYAIQHLLKPFCYHVLGSVMTHPKDK